MSSETSEPTAVAATQPSKGRKAAASKPTKTKSKPDHPKVADMVVEAIRTLKERKGSSVQAIKKFISSHYAVEVDKLAPHIRKALKSGVESNKLVQTKGKGASGSFKLAPAEPKKASPKGPIRKVKAEKPKAKVAKSPIKVKVTKSPKKVAKATKKPVAAVKTPTKKASAKSPKAKVARKPKVKTPKPKTVKKAPAKKTKPVQKGSPAKKAPSRAAKK